MSVHSSCTHVELHVDDFAKVEAFYGMLGFVVVWRSDDDVDGYLVMRKGDAVLRFWPGSDLVRDHAYFVRFPSDAPRGLGVELVFSFDDLDTVYMAASAAGAVVEEMQLRPWGLRDFRVADPFGYYLRITEPHDVLTMG